LGIGAFVYNGLDYTYFGLFPSVIRMPILLVTSRLDGQMIAPWRTKWARVNVHRRHFLAANGGKVFGFAFLPGTLAVPPDRYPRTFHIVGSIACAPVDPRWGATVRLG
jgi:hypothetical protein